MIKNTEQTGDMLIKIMADKTLDPSKADEAFDLFCAKYEARLLPLVEGLCAKLGYSADIAFKAVECAFARVRKYPTFDKLKSKSKNIDNAIVLWVNKIAYTQVLKFKNNGECANVSHEEDLAVITNASEFYEIASKYNYISEEEKAEKIARIESKMSELDAKHRVVLLTYLAYESQYKTLPRSLLLKLRTLLNLSQSSIRVYKKEALDKLMSI